jgi:hypothetical protein
MSFRPRVACIVLGTSFGCTTGSLITESRVGVRARTGDDDSAVVVVHDSTACTVAIRDQSGVVHDRWIEDGRSVAIDMTRPLASDRFRVTTPTHPATLLTTLTMPPGRYTVVAYETTDEFDDLGSDRGGPVRSADCSSGVQTRRVALPFRVEAGRMTFLHLPTGRIDFPTLALTHAAERDPFVSARFASWLPGMRTERARLRRTLAERRKSPRDGYDVYPNCDGRTAVVRKAGTPFDWYRQPGNDAARRQFRHRAAIPLKSVHATGFGHGCVESLAFVFILSDGSAMEDAVRAIGEFMKREDLAGEIDLVVMPVSLPL